MLQHQATAEAVISTLSNLSTEIVEALDTVYGRSLQRFERYDRRSRQVAGKALSWITFARRPLTSAELCCAIARDLTSQEDKLPEAGNLVNLCADFVTFENTNNLIRFKHSTMQPYFRQKQHPWLLQAETTIAGICASYLSLGAFQTGICRTDEAFAERLHSYPLYDYAARYWGRHARNASVLEPVVMEFLQNRAIVEAASQALLVDKESLLRDYSR